MASSHRNWIENVFYLFESVDNGRGEKKPSTEILFDSDKKMPSNLHRFYGLNVLGVETKLHCDQDQHNRNEKEKIGTFTSQSSFIRFSQVDTVNVCVGMRVCPPDDSSMLWNNV